jgi:hypothetical protein
MPEEADAAAGCPHCGTDRQPGQLLCHHCYVPFSLAVPVAPVAPSQPADVSPADRGPGSAPAARPPLSRAPSGRSADPRLRTSGDPDHTRVINVIPGALRGPAQTRRDAPPRALRLRFPSGEIVPVEPGVRIRLGRDAQMCPAVKFLAVYDNLSRLHAVVGVETDGSAWITDEGSTNGTFVHGYRLAPEERATLRPGDTVRLASDVTVNVLL